MTDKRRIKKFIENKLTEYFLVDKSKLDDNKSFYGLGLDDLDVAEFLICVEFEYSIEFHDLLAVSSEDMTINKLLDIIYNKLTPNGLPEKVIPKNKNQLVSQDNLHELLDRVYVISENFNMFILEHHSIKDLQKQNYDLVSLMKTVSEELGDIYQKIGNEMFDEGV